MEARNYKDRNFSVTLNDRMGGIELKFEKKMSEDEIADVKDAGFKWSKRQQLWYAYQNEKTVAFANSLIEDAETARESHEDPQIQYAKEQSENEITVNELAELVRQRNELDKRIAEIQKVAVNGKTVDVSSDQAKELLLATQGIVEREVVGVGVAPTISALRFNEEPPATSLRPSPTAYTSSVQQEQKSVNFSEKTIEQIEQEHAQNEAAEITEDDLRTAKKFIPTQEYIAMLGYANGGEESEFYKRKIKHVAEMGRTLYSNSDGKSYNNKTKLHDKGFMHYYGGSDFYICEVDKDGRAFGYTVLNGDTQMSEYGYTMLSEITSLGEGTLGATELDLYIDDGVPMEHAIHQKYPVLFAEEYEQEIENEQQADTEFPVKENLTPTEMKKIREEAKRILSEHTDEEIRSNPEMLELLAQYEGGGGLSNEKERTNAEVLNAFYTPRSVVEAVWKLADHYAPQAKTVLEPSSGIGRFAENRPDNQFTLRELDETSARIAKILHPDAEVIQGAFERQFFDDDGRVHLNMMEPPKYDIVIGNPPYGENKSVWRGRGEGKDFVRIEEYFLSRGLDSLKDENSVLLYVMPSSFLKSGGNYAKDILAPKGKIIDAYRLPNGAFDSTDAGTDIIVLKQNDAHKKVVDYEGDLAEMPEHERSELGKAISGNARNFADDNWFKAHPEKILGEEYTAKDRWGKDAVMVRPHEGKTLRDELDEIAKQIGHSDINNAKENLPKISYYVRTNSEFDSETVAKNLTAKEAVRMAYELTEQEKKKNGGFENGVVSYGVSMHVPGDLVFDDPEQESGFMVVNNWYGDRSFAVDTTIFDQDPEKPVYIAARKELEEALQELSPEYQKKLDSEILANDEKLKQKNNSAKQVHTLPQEAVEKAGLQKAFNGFYVRAKGGEEIISQNLTAEKAASLAYGLAWEAAQNGSQTQYEIYAQTSEISDDQLKGFRVANQLDVESIHFAEDVTTLYDTKNISPETAGLYKRIERELNAALSEESERQGMREYEKNVAPLVEAVFKENPLFDLKPYDQAWRNIRPSEVAEKLSALESEVNKMLKLDPRLPEKEQELAKAREEFSARKKQAQEAYDVLQTKEKEHIDLCHEKTVRLEDVYKNVPWTTLESLREENIRLLHQAYKNRLDDETYRKNDISEYEIKVDALSLVMHSRNPEFFLVEEMKNGLGFEGSKFRIYNFYQKDKSLDGLAKYLKQEAGIGGHSDYAGFVNMSPKGIVKTLYRDSDGKDPREQVHYTWSQAARVVKDLIESNSYLTEEERQNPRLQTETPFAIKRDSDIDIDEDEDEENEIENEDKIEHAAAPEPYSNDGEFTQADFDRMRNAISDKTRRNITDSFGTVEHRGEELSFSIVHAGNGEKQFIARGAGAEYSCTISPTHLDLQDGYESFVQFARDKINDTLGIGFSIDDEEYLDRLSEVFDVNAEMHAERITQAEADAQEFYENSVQNESGYSFKEYAAGQMAVGFILDKFPEIKEIAEDGDIGAALDEIGTKIAAGEITKENLRSELDKVVQERQVEAPDIATNFVLEKLAKAGIEVVTDKTEFDKILANTERLQKMVRKLDDFQKLKNELDGLNKKSKETKQNVMKTENSLALDNQERYEKDFVELKDTILRLSDFIDDEIYKKLNSRIFNQNNIELLDLYPFEENKENRYVLGILNSELYDSGIYEYLSLRKSDFMAHVFVDEIGKEIEASETTTENFAKYMKNCSENFHAKCVEDEIYESLKEQIDTARKDIEKNINIIFVNKNINSLTAKESYELKQKLLQLPYIKINGVNVYANKIDEVNKKQFLDELQLSKLFEKHGYEVFILPEQYTEKQKHADVLETEKGNDIENGDFLDLKNLTTKNIRQVGKKFSEGKEQARDVLIYLHEDFSDKDLVHEIDWRIKHELQPQNINGKLVVVFEKSHQYLEYAIKKDGIQPIIKDSVKPSVQAEAEKNIPATPPKNIIPQSENLSSGKIQFMRINSIPFEKFTIGNISEIQLAEAKDADVNLEGYKHEITNEFIAHVIKQHGNTITESARGQIAITEKDLKSIGDVINCPDKVVYGTTYKEYVGGKFTDRERVVYAKNMPDGTSLYFEEVLSGKKNKTLRGTTLFKRLEEVSDKKLTNIIKGTGYKANVDNIKIKVRGGAAISPLTRQPNVDAAAISASGEPNISISDFVDKSIASYVSSKKRPNSFIHDGTTYGFTHNDKIYLNPDVMNSEAAVHEYTHLWDEYTRRTNPELWQKGKDILTKTHLWEEVKSDPNYADIADDDNLVLSECHARICGKIAAQVLERMAAQDGEIAKDAAIDWDKETWEYIKENLYDEIWKNKDYPLFTQQEFEGIKYFRKDGPRLETQLMFSELSDFLAQPMSDLMSGKNILLEQTKEVDKKQNRPIYFDDLSELQQKEAMEAFWEGGDSETIKGLEEQGLIETSDEIAVAYPGDEIMATYIRNLNYDFNTDYWQNEQYGAFADIPDEITVTQDDIDQYRNKLQRQIDRLNNREDGNYYDEHYDKETKEYIARLENMSDEDVKNAVLWEKENRKRNKELHHRAVDYYMDLRERKNTLQEGEVFSYNETHPAYKLTNTATGMETYIQSDGDLLKNVEKIGRLSSLTEAEKAVSQIKEQGFDILSTSTRIVVFNKDVFYDFDEYGDEGRFNYQTLHYDFDLNPANLKGWDFKKFVDNGCKVTKEMKDFAKKTSASYVLDKKTEEINPAVQKKPGDTLTIEEFSRLYGKEFDRMEFDIWKATDWEGKIDVSKLTKPAADRLLESPNYVEAKPGEFVHKALFVSGDIGAKIKYYEDAIEKIKNGGKTAFEHDGEKFYYQPESVIENFQKNIAVLQEALPTPIPIEKMHFGVNTTIAEEFKIRETLSDGDTVDLNLQEKFVLWAHGHKSWQSAVDDERYHRTSIDWATANISREEFPDNLYWHDIIEYIEKKPVKANPTHKRYGMTEEDVSAMKAQKKREADEKRMARAETADKLFDRFLHEGLTQEEQKLVENEYNKRFNSYVAPDYSKLPLFIDGMSAFKDGDRFRLYDQQIKGVSFCSNKGNGLLAYDVGVGKTAAGIVANANQLQLGRSAKPLIVVPNSVYSKWYNDLRELFPNIPVNDLYNLNKESTAKFRDSENPHKLNIPEGSISLVTYEALTRNVTFRNETCENELYEDFSRLLSEDVPEGGTDDERNATQKAKDSGKIANAIGVASQVKNPSYVFFEDCGWDNITVDEAHNFKNLWTIPRPKNKGESNEFSGIPTGKPSQRALKLYAMTQYVQKHNDNRNVFLLTATPFTNSPLEVYSMLSYVGRQRLMDSGIYSLRDFLNQFAHTKLEIAVNARGEIDYKQVMKDWKELPALQNMLTEYIDKVDGDEAGIIRPKKFTHVKDLDPNELQKKMIEADTDHMLEVKEGNSAAVIVSMNAMRIALVAPALGDRTRYDFPLPPMEQLVETSPKLKFVCDSIIEMYKDNPEKGQFMYMPLGQQAHGIVKDYLVRHGIPKDAVEVINGSVNNSVEKKEKITERFNDEKDRLKIIIGGKNTSEGIDLNGNSFVMYNCSLGWNPSETIQAEGRIWRQGNMQGNVHCVYPVMNDSIDSVLYQKHDEKRSRINDLWTYKGDKLNIEDIKPEDLKFDLIKDPRKRAKLVLDETTKELKAELQKTKTRIETYDEIVEKNVKLKEQLEETQATLAANENLKKKYEKENLELPTWLKMEIAGAKKDIKSTTAKMETVQSKLDKLGIHNDGESAAYIRNLNVQKHSLEKQIEMKEHELPDILKRMKIELMEKKLTLPPVEEQRKELCADIRSNLRPMKEVEVEIKQLRFEKMLEDQFQHGGITKEEFDLYKSAGYKNYEKWREGEIESLEAVTQETRKEKPVEIEAAAEIEFDARNFDEVKKLVEASGIEAVQKPDGQVVLNGKDGETAVFKQDVVRVKDGTVEVQKPSFLGNQTTTVEPAVPEKAVEKQGNLFEEEYLDALGAKQNETASRKNYRLITYTSDSGFAERGNFESDKLANEAGAKFMRDWNLPLSENGFVTYNEEEKQIGGGMGIFPKEQYFSKEILAANGIAAQTEKQEIKVSDIAQAVKEKIQEKTSAGDEWTKSHLIVVSTPQPKKQAAGMEY